LKVASNWDTEPVYDVIAKIPGSVAPDEWIVRGNHHDAWVNGAEDPISAQVSLLEEARALSLLLKQAGSRGAPSSMPRGMAKSPCCWARPNGSKLMPM